MVELHHAYKIMPGPNDGRTQRTPTADGMHVANQQQLHRTALQQGFTQGNVLTNTSDYRRKITLAQLVESNAARVKQNSFRAPVDNDYLEWKQLNAAQRMEKIHSFTKGSGDTEVSGFSEKGIKAMLKLVFSERYYPDLNSAESERNRWESIKNNIDGLNFVEPDPNDENLKDAGTVYISDYVDSHRNHFKNTIFYKKASDIKFNVQIQQMKDDL